MTAYLDSNILIYIENGAIDLNDLIFRIDSKIQKVYYSSAHLQEADEIQGKTEIEREQRISKRLETIEKVTGCNLVYQDLDNKVFFQKLKPDIMLSTIREVPFGKSMMKSLANLIPEEQRRQYRESLGFETLHLNNYKPHEVIEHLNTKLSILDEKMSFLEILELGISYHPQKDSFGLSNRIAGVFELLDFFGYWKDGVNKKSNYARLWDSTHTFYAAHCDYFVSDDKRTRNKAKVVYSIYDVGTTVVSSNGAE